MKDGFGLFLMPGIGIGTAVGIAIKNIPAASSMGMIIGLISGLFKRLV